jgi:exosome complex RNA-binding protein Csl4
LEKAQIEYYKGLGAKAKDWAADAARKGTLTEEKLRIKTSIDTVKAQLLSLVGDKGDAAWMGQGDEVIAEVKRLRKELEGLRVQYGAFSKYPLPTDTFAPIKKKR